MVRRNLYSVKFRYLNTQALVYSSGMEPEGSQGSRGLI